MTFAGAANRTGLVYIKRRLKPALNGILGLHKAMTTVDDRLVGCSMRIGFGKGYSMPSAKIGSRRKYKESGSYGRAELDNDLSSKLRLKANIVTRLVPILPSYPNLRRGIVQQFKIHPANPFP